MTSDFRHKKGRGSLFRAQSKSKSNSPDYYGTATLPDGTQVRLSGWRDEQTPGDRLNLKIEVLNE